MHKNQTIKRFGKKGQTMAEYLILFSVVVAAIIFGVTTFVGPSLGNLYQRTSGVIDAITPTLVCGN